MEISWRSWSYSILWGFSSSAYYKTLSSICHNEEQFWKCHFFDDCRICESIFTIYLPLSHIIFIWLVRKLFQLIASSIKYKLFKSHTGVANELLDKHFTNSSLVSEIMIAIAGNICWFSSCLNAIDHDKLLKKFLYQSCWIMTFKWNQIENRFAEIKTTADCKC